MRRFYCERIANGKNLLAERESHHARRVLRLKPGCVVEIFDGKGAMARGAVSYESDSAAVTVDEISHREKTSCGISCAVAFPKGPRADFMVQKLSEIGIDRITPLLCGRSVTVPSATKRERLSRIAADAARQSGNDIIPVIAEPELIKSILAQPPTIKLLASPKSESLLISFRNNLKSPLLYLIGPEGGLTDDEESMLINGGFQQYSLGRGILRIETAAICSLALFSQLMRS